MDAKRRPPIASGLCLKGNRSALRRFIVVSGTLSHFAETATFFLAQ